LLPFFGKRAPPNFPSLKKTPPKSPSLEKNPPNFPLFGKEGSGEILQSQIPLHPPFLKGERNGRAPFSKGKVPIIVSLL
jgi:hypothetical protein